MSESQDINMRLWLTNTDIYLRWCTIQHKNDEYKETNNSISSREFRSWIFRQNWI